MEDGVAPVRWSAEARRLLRMRRRIGVAAFVVIAVAVIIFRMPELSVAGLACAAKDSWLPAAVLGVLLASLAVDLVSWTRYGLGCAAIPLDLRIGAGVEGGGHPVFYSRRAKWLVLYPFAIVMTFVFLRFSSAPAC